MVENPPTNAGDLRDSGSIPRPGRCPGGGHGNPLQYSCLENPMDRGAWRATVAESLSLAASAPPPPLQPVQSSQHLDCREEKDPEVKYPSKVTKLPSTLTVIRPTPKSQSSQSAEITQAKAKTAFLKLRVTKLSDY